MVSRRWDVYGTLSREEITDFHGSNIKVKALYSLDFVISAGRQHLHAITFPWFSWFPLSPKAPNHYISWAYLASLVYKFSKPSYSLGFHGFRGLPNGREQATSLRLPQTKQTREQEIWCFGTFADHGSQGNRWYIMVGALGGQGNMENQGNIMVRSFWKLVSQGNGGHIIVRNLL